MADNRLPVQDVTAAGVVPAKAVEGALQGELNATDNYQVRNDGRVMLQVEKSAGASADVDLTFDTPGEIDDVSIDNPVVNIAIGEEKLIGPFRPYLYNDTNEDLRFTLDDPDGLTIAVMRLPL